MIINIRLLIIFFCLNLILSCHKDDPDNGTRKIYSEKSGKLIQEVEYRNGKKNGYFREYYDDGKLSAVQFYVNDTINDTSFAYHPNGIIASQSVYKMGRKNGVWKKYNKAGMRY